MDQILKSIYKIGLVIIILIGFQNNVFAEGDGFGENPGGAGGDTVIVDNKVDLANYAAWNEPYVIFVKDTINVSSIRVNSYKTIAGLDSTSTILGNLSVKGGTNNVVIKNLNISNPSGDGITIREGKYVYVTNCTVYDCGDGCIDITVESDFVTVSFCRFYYDKVTFHKFVNLIGASDNDVSDRGKLHVTLHHNWWDTGCTSRMPRVRFGRVHVYNNYFSCEGNNYANRAAIEAEVYSEYNYFDGVRDPLTVDQGGKAKSIGNEYVNCSGIIYPGNDNVFTPSYNYTTTNAQIAKDSVFVYAGNKSRGSVADDEKKQTKITWYDLGEIIYGTPLTKNYFNAKAAGNTSTPVYSHNVGDTLPEGHQTITVTFPEDANYKAASKTVNIKVNYEYYSLSVLSINSTNTNLIKISPEGTQMNGTLKFPKNTVVSITASSNLLSTFDHWSNGETDTTISVTMIENMELTAFFNKPDYIVAWDLVEAGNYNRVADYYANDENHSAFLELKYANGNNTVWGLYSGTNKLLGKNAATIRRAPSSAGDFYFQVNFNAGKFENIQVKASMLGMLTYYQVQNVEYSTDGTNFQKAGEFNLEQDSVWYNGTFQLGNDANGCESVMVRFKADKNSILISNGVIGTSISEIVVLGDNRNTTSVLDNKANLQIVEKQYYSIDGKRLKFPKQGINIVLIKYNNGSKEAKKVFFNNSENIVKNE